MCQLCGCWYGTRKGLSSHARAHLRQIGIPDNQVKGSPIDMLYQIMEEEDLKPISGEKQQKPPSNSSPKPSSKRPSDVSSPHPSPASKRPKTGNFTCVLCGEGFETRKNLGIHARAHLRQMGVVDLPGKSSAVDTIQELVDSGIVEAIHSPKTSSKISSPAAKFASTSQSPVNKAPKAKKGFRLAVDPLHRKPKPEPVEFEVSDEPMGSSTNISSPTQKSPGAVLNAGTADSH